jgi:hypothetical protein
MGETPEGIATQDWCKSQSRETHHIGLRKTKNHSETFAEQRLEGERRASHS